jgi:hypothetical protein
VRLGDAVLLAALWLLVLPLLLLLLLLVAGPGAHCRCCCCCWCSSRSIRGFLGESFEADDREELLCLLVKAGRPSLPASAPCCCCCCCWGMVLSLACGLYWRTDVPDSRGSSVTCERLLPAL